MHSETSEAYLSPGTLDPPEPLSLVHRPVLVDGGHTEGLRHGHVGDVLVLALVAEAAEGLEEGAAELFAAGAVDDEVDGGVDGDEQVADVRDVVARRAQVGEVVIVSVEDAPHGVRDEGRDVAQEEDDNHHDHHARDAVPLGLALRHVRAQLLGHAQGHDQAVVEDHKNQHRRQVHDDEIQADLIDDGVVLVFVHLRSAVYSLAVLASDQLVLEEARNVVDQRYEDHEDELAACAAQGAEPRCVQRLTDSDVAVDGQQHGYPYRGHAHDAQQRVDHYEHVMERVAILRKVPPILRTNVQDPEEDEDENDAVGECQAPEEHVRGVLALLFPEHDYRD